MSASGRRKNNFFKPPSRPARCREIETAAGSSESLDSQNSLSPRSVVVNSSRVTDPDPVFNMPLRALMVDQGHGYIPYIIEKCFVFIKRHINTEGLFRISGNTPTISALIEAFDSGKRVRLKDYTRDPHDVCTLVKKFLQQLAEPIIDEKMSLELIASQRISDPKTRLAKIRDVCDNIGEYERALLECIIDFLQRIAEHSDKNKMGIENLAMVFGPVLTKQPTATMTTAFQDIHALNSVIAEMIKHAGELFGIKHLTGEFADYYEILEELGSGAFATVYLVRERNAKVQKNYAAKVIKGKSLADEDMHRLNDEISILTRVRHPNIITLHAVFSTESEVILVMELAEGGELFQKLIDDGQYKESDAVRILQQIIKAVEYLHSLNIVHRDLKPENILLKNKTTREIKLCDFGLSKVFDTAEMNGTLCGTPGYVAPEILFENSYGKPVDMWSIGVIAYVLLSGHAPFYSENLQKLFAQIKRAQYDFSDDEWEGVSDEAKDFIIKLLVLDPSKRLTARQALHHPFLSGRSTTLDSIKAAGLLKRERHLRQKGTLIMRREMEKMESPTPEAVPVSSNHTWENTRFKTVVTCDNCNQYMWPFYKKAQKCADCQLRCHRRCLDHLDSQPCIHHS